MSLTWETVLLMFAYVGVTYDVQLMIKLENGTYLILASSLPLFCLFSLAAALDCAAITYVSVWSATATVNPVRSDNFMFDMSDRYILN